MRLTAAVQDLDPPTLGVLAREPRRRELVETLDDLQPVLESVLADGDLVLLMGAGDIGAYAAGLPERLSQKPNLKVHS